ncbi:cancer-related nucleoside-triphosphatase homolog [Ptychodera flava]|uniref:cancer-related nucleoside-triphosphatase homolog n=1 Tax=Ptychodera flava TaxID=63121 RepID=UPI00396A5B9A
MSVTYKIWKVMAASVGSIRHVLLTGPPGIGKTTLVRKVSEELSNGSVTTQGFYTEEVRGGHGKRVGFDVVTLDGQRGILARVSSDGRSHGGGGGRREYRVGQYSVNLRSFEEIALPVLRSKDPRGKEPVFVIDEIGKMEMFSEAFKDEVKRLLNMPGSTVLATIPVPKGKTLPFVEDIRNRKDVRIFTVTRENRDGLQTDILAAVRQARS